mmetsp:Transcript_128758/g.181670  ORF Transcript_128758/g.181670 Transcript_128758/m.181670 type:complete len:112 (+) Transcript_128758:389-724(+)
MIDELIDATIDDVDDVIADICDWRDEMVPDIVDTVVVRLMADPPPMNVGAGVGALLGAIKLQNAEPATIDMFRMAAPSSLSRSVIVWTPAVTVGVAKIFGDHDQPPVVQLV